MEGSDHFLQNRNAELRTPYSKELNAIESLRHTELACDMHMRATQNCSDETRIKDEHDEIQYDVCTDASW